MTVKTVKKNVAALDLAIGDLRALYALLQDGEGELGDDTRLLASAIEQLERIQQQDVNSSYAVTARAIEFLRAMVAGNFISADMVLRAVGEMKIGEGPIAALRRMGHLKADNRWWSHAWDYIAELEARVVCRDDEMVEGLTRLAEYADRTLKAKIPL